MRKIPLPLPQCWGLLSGLRLVLAQAMKAARLVNSRCRFGTHSPGRPAAST